MQRHKTEREIAIETRRKAREKTGVGILIILIRLKGNSSKDPSTVGKISPLPCYRCAQAQAPADGRTGS